MSTGRERSSLFERQIDEILTRSERTSLRSYVNRLALFLLVCGVVILTPEGAIPVEPNVYRSAPSTQLPYPSEATPMPYRLTIPGNSNSLTRLMVLSP